MRLPVQQSLNSDRYKITPIESGNYFAASLGIEPESCKDDGIGKPKRLKKILSVCGIILVITVVLVALVFYIANGAFRFSASR